MTIAFGNPDRPNSYIGKTVPRPNAGKLVQGRGRYVDDIVLPRMVHVAFVRSPFAHARITGVDLEEASRVKGVLRIFTGADLAKVCTPWVGVLAHLKGLKSAPQHALAVDRAAWVGEPVVAVVASTRAAAEDGAALVEVDYDPLEAVTDTMTALDADTPVIHPELGDNLAFQRLHEEGDVEAAMASAYKVVSARFRTARHTGVTLEPRSILVDWNPAEGQMTAYHATQAPHMIQTVLAKHLDLPEGRVRVICGDVGGSYGIKVHVYPDEVATAAISKVMGRPVKFIADRLESFSTDIHARDHEIEARIAVDAEGSILAIDVDDWTGIGPYSVYPRTSAIEGNQVVNLCGGPYDFANYRAKTTVVFQNKSPTCQYRAVGHPIAVAITEGLVDMAAAAIGMDPVEIRRRNMYADDAYPVTSPAKMRFEGLSHHASMDKLLAMMDYDALRADQAEARKKGKHRGIGIASFIELTNPSPFMYGIGGARISAQDGCTVRMDPDGSIVALSGVTEQGQGTEAMLSQIVAEGVGVNPSTVRIITGDTQVTPYGGGTWASRGAGIGGEAALQAARALRQSILEVAAAMLQADADALDIRDGQVVTAATGEDRLPLEELGRIVYFRGDTLPKGLPRELVQTRHYITMDYPFAFTNGVQASYVEVDTDTGVVSLLKHWCVEDCGRVINPQLVDEQIRGGIVQGLGGALFEEIHYDSEGQLLNGSMADYLVPMAAEMPDMQIGHVETPTAESELGAKGAGEAGTAGAPAAVMNAINDALRPMGAQVTEMPFTPERILRALGTLTD
ncbi:xanthine dehydrogenase family protein molybdopterin-binding subunit [Mameliella sediminis]|uniref:xanthine dehydrogenase family protein molybdopterin-binding subunit n=1 Tax=Mameliella sediminis TaxID=2836866 RepID=UPI001C46FF9A|nr:xanthine dehydrogenase family protein molybdopterin-binding subunit [Mameliella sediminis]MBV7396586.1 xanthine dehydrogenase family protein molybdopterin-binding subunit [Mameliella sediminis]MBY6162875.1 xanthine dehydrogenase family protein molybdopterin-binding subunit [Mameliella alba]MBY6171139.1 xanthine dehydrogenase family protein molybdopterin-binding subunit [Mameliella alba]MBY6176363.1 xanthine dehydrogenase family protein molybdopterin-binding subunit [Mameliella alba]